MKSLPGRRNGCGRAGKTSAYDNEVPVSLLHFFNLRCCNRAQWEIRALAYKMLAEVKKVAPLLFKNAGATCVQTGRCPEGKMTCGKFNEMMKLREE